MAISASARHHLFRKVEELFGPEDGATLMDSLPPGGWDDVATRSDVVAIKADLESVKTELRGEMRDLEQRLIERIDLRLDARLAANQRSTLTWMVAMQATTLGAVIAAVRL